MPDSKESDWFRKFYVEYVYYGVFIIIKNTALITLQDNTVPTKLDTDGFLNLHLIIFFLKYVKMSILECQHHTKIFLPLAGFNKFF